jgi:hypothetical protein
MAAVGRERFSAQYARARAIGLDCLADRVLEIAETPLVAEKRVQKADGSVEITTADAVDRSRLTVDSLKSYLCKLAPKKYGLRRMATDRGSRRPSQRNQKTGKDLTAQLAGSI